MSDKKNLLLSVENLSAVYFSGREKLQAVEDINLEISKGSVFALVGKSGCGKTTVALSILRLIPNYQGKIFGGHIYLQGRDLLALSEKQMRKVRGGEIAVIFQHPASSLNPVLTIGNQIAEAVKLHQKKTSKKAFHTAVEMLVRVGIEEPETKARQYPHQLSGGMLQRVMIAMALACRPKLIIADEPTSSLDVTTERAILDLLCGLKQTEGVGILLITHNLAIVADRADNLGVMQNGRIIEKGDTKNIIKNPAHPCTKTLLADAWRNKL